MKRTMQTLHDCGGIVLHKIVSNDIRVMNAFDESDLAKDMKGIDLKTVNFLCNLVSVYSGT